MKKDITKEKNWSIVKSEYLFNRPWLTVRKDCVRLPDGRENPEFYVLEYPDWVNVIAITEDGKYIMEKQYRHGLGITEYELCAGVIEQGDYHNYIMNSLEIIRNDEYIIGVIMQVNSPGGGVYESAEISDKIQQIKTEKNIAFYTVMGSVVASGGYYVSALTDKCPKPLQAQSV